MNGMIFAAGLGTRLKPLTDHRPKALVELEGCPLLERVILKMKEAGVQRIVVNVHHYAGQIEDFLSRHHYFEGDVVVSDERNCLLDTGGGLLKARELFKPDEPVLIHNVDILSNLDLKKLMAAHAAGQEIATLVVGPGEPERGFRFNDAGLLKGWENTLTGEQKIVDSSFHTSRPYAFCGIHVVSPEFLENMTHRGIFSIIDEYLCQAVFRPVSMYFYDGPFLDLGTPEAIVEAEKWLLRN